VAIVEEKNKLRNQQKKNQEGQAREKGAHARSALAGCSGFEV